MAVSNGRTFFFFSKLHISQIFIFWPKVKFKLYAVGCKNLTENKLTDLIETKQ